ncbi:MAG: hypothetical protein Q9M25_08150 [Mariprofundaceae bacterium]|nr:hypothetical protein [Mariprofundaceae bacterium]
MWVGVNSSLQDICRQLVQNHDAPIAAGVIDLDTATVLAAFHEVAYFTEAYVETLMEASANMFRGPVIEEIDELISAQKNRPFARHMQEVYFRTPHTHHFLCLIPETPAALILVSSIHAPRDTAWQLAQATLAKLRPHCPCASIAEETNL